MADSDKVTYDNDTLLDELNKEKTTEYAPVIAYVAIVMTMGILGNIMTVIFYGFKTKKTTNTVMLSCLAAIDLTTCVIFLDEIIQICFSLTFKNVVGCRFMYFINHWLVGSSVLVLWLICIDRYIHVCRYFAWQFTILSVKVAIAIVVGVSLVVSIPNTVMRDIVRVNVNDSHGHTVQGFICTRSDDQELKSTLTAFNVMDVIILAVATITFVVLYSLIIRTIFISRKKTISVISIKHRNASIVSDTNTTSDTEVKERSSQVEDGMASEVDNTDRKKDTPSVSACDKPQRQPTRPMSFQNTFQIEIRITFIMIAITVGFLVSFIPYFIVNIAFRPNSETIEELNVGIQLGLRSYMVNSAINPYIIGFFNPVFRQFVMQSLCRCRFCKFQQDRNSQLTLESCTTKGL